MRKAAGRSLLFCLALLLVAGCADDTKYQFGLRGKWQLEQRASADGAVFKPPAISGIYEWYPMTKTKAHVTAAVSPGEDKVMVSTFTIEMTAGKGFTRHDYIKISGGYGTTYQPTYETPDADSQGTLSGEGNRRVLTYADGSVQTYPDVTVAGVEAASFTVRFPDGTVDTWRRIADQLGVLPK